MNKKIKDKVVTIRLTADMYAELGTMAEVRKCGVADVLRGCIRVGLLAFSGDTADVRVMVKDGDEWKPVMLI